MYVHVCMYIYVCYVCNVCMYAVHVCMCVCYVFIRESVDSLCRDGADAQYMQYLSKSHTTSPQTRYIVCILFGMPSLHPFTFFKSCVFMFVGMYVYYVCTCMYEQSTHHECTCMYCM